MFSTINIVEIQWYERQRTVFTSKKKYARNISALLACGFFGTFMVPSAGAAEVPSSEATSISQEEIVKHFENQKNFASSEVAETPGQAISNNKPGASTQELFAPSRVENVQIQEGVASPEILGTCRTATGKGTCTISEERTISASVDAQISVGFQDVNAAVGGTYAESITKNWECTDSPTGQTQLEMHPSGIFVQFEYVKRVAGVETARYPGSAFIPTGVDCQISNV